MIYGKYAQEYFEKEIIPVPITQGTKACFVDNWQMPETHIYSDKFINKYKNYGIGVLCGAPSNIIVVDIDAYDEEIKEKISRQLPKPLVGKIGNKLKGTNIFFQYSGERSAKFYYKGKMAVEILSNGNQTVIPPTMHPEKGYAYEWVNNSLLDVDIDDLPKLSEHFIDWCYKNLESKGDNVSEGGRNDVLSKQASAATFSGKDPTLIIKELVEYDSLNHSPPLFSDHKEPGMRDHSPLMNAQRFYFSIYKSIHRSKKQIPDWSSSKIEIIDSPTKATGYKTDKLPKFRGVAQDIFSYIYDNSPVSRTRMSYASTISLMSVLLSNRVRINSIYSNIYSLIIAPSGTGKNFPLNAPVDILHAAKMQGLANNSRPSSDAAILKPLSTLNNRLDVIDEMSGIFLAMNNFANSFQSGMQDIYASLFTSVGRPFGGRALATADKPRGKCYSPCVSLLGAMTIQDFKNCFNTTIMEKGLGGRFLYFPDSESNRMPRDKGNTDVPQEIIKAVQKIRPQQNDFNFNDSPPPSIKIDLPVKNKIEEIQREIYKKQVQFDDTSKMKPLYNRMYEQFIKFVMIDVVSNNHDCPFSKLKASVSNVEWAYNSIMQITKCTEIFLEENLNSSDNEKILNAIESEIKNFGVNGVSLTDLSKKYTFRKYGRKCAKNALFDLLESEKIFEKSVTGKTKTTKKYYSSDFVKEL